MTWGALDYVRYGQGMGEQTRDAREWRDHRIKQWSDNGVDRCSSLVREFEEYLEDARTALAVALQRRHERETLDAALSAEYGPALTS